MAGDLHALVGIAGGLIATAVMTLIEVVFWQRWGLLGVLEWHENQVLVSRFLNLNKEQLHYSGIFGLHFLNGALGGLGLAVALYLIPSFLDVGAIIPLTVLAAGYGLFLWLLTLVPIHKPITGIHPWNHPYGRGPAFASLTGHLVYGTVLGIFFVFLLHS